MFTLLLSVITFFIGAFFGLMSTTLADSYAQDFVKATGYPTLVKSSCTGMMQSVLYNFRIMDPTLLEHDARKGLVVLISNTALEHQMNLEAKAAFARCAIWVTARHWQMKDRKAFNNSVATDLNVPVGML